MGMMETPFTDLTCADVESRDLEAGYLARRLSPAAAAAFEAHYFGCDRCWPALRRANETRAAFALPIVRSTHRRWRNWGLASAATLVIAVGTSMLIRASPSDIGTGPRGTALGGSADSLAVRASASEGRLTVEWSAFPDADRYRVRLHRADGEVVLERETADTSFTVHTDSLEHVAPVSSSGATSPTTATTAMYWQVQAIDRLRQPLVRSPLTPAAPSSPPP